MSHVKRCGRPDIHRSVIQRSLRDMDIVVVRHDAQEHEQAAGRSCRLVGMRVWQISANPFRPPCGAGSVEHERACGEIFGSAGGLAGQQVLERLAAFNLPHRKTVRHIGFADSPLRFAGEAVAHDQGFRFAVGENVSHFRAGQMPVDRGHIQARLIRSQADRHLLQAIGKQGRNLVAFLQPQRSQPVHDLIGEIVKLSCRRLVVVRVYHCQAVGRQLGYLPKSERVGDACCAFGCCAGFCGVGHRLLLCGLCLLSLRVLPNID